MKKKGRSRFTAQRVCELRHEYKTTTIGQVEMAEREGVTQSSMSLLLTGKTYKEVECKGEKK